MKVKTPVPGGVCQSLQGRDKGRYYLIKTVNSDGTCSLVDGNFRKFASPKRKNLKHLRLLPDISASIASKLVDGRQIFDTEIFSALKTYNCPEKQETAEVNEKPH